MRTTQKRTTSKTLQIETRIRSCIAALGVTQVAKGMGVHHSQISRMQTGKKLLCGASRQIAGCYRFR
ncbi:CII family transcriptional regulator [Cronobacter sakazakii]|uniref:CII family transcriptional regulator n=1 Tax=Cronobacter sakazakii TaxID=28141 RepID=UPI001D038180|nr:CII family transcriptional regulator [Cronobacter sakazakii]MDI7343072.1 CII family transcriptional regulator [Cronobacter sakazakii]MDI7508515.1 CII family transcriptional regulator [Cronobacter sakazakii]MDI7528744.1 CII family transcriptional regulator [Cronobacter sakazakii]MDI7545864.1 CII family transcriptional regulator [Cronobacter sakazakii]MDI7655058.1 CII family transcriptional regulator [Cronobacter sakazakii]